MAGSLLLLISLLFITDSLSSTGASEDADSESTYTSIARATVGETAFLTCHLPSTGQYDDVYWARQQADRALVTHKKRFSVRLGRLEASCSLHGDDCLLMIKNVRKDDSGLYHCGVNNVEPPVQRSVYLSVYVPVAKIFREPFREHWQGSQLKLTCVVQPRPAMDDMVFWMHDDLVMNPAQDSRLTITTEADTSTISNLLLEDAQPEDSGTYTCKLLSGSSDSVDVEVKQVPVPKILGEPFRAQWQGSQMNLTCVVQPGRAVDDVVLWMHGDLLINPVHDSRLTITTETNTSTVSHLLLEDTQPEDSGTYTCKLLNGRSDSVDVDVMQVVRDDFYPIVSGAQKPLVGVPIVGSVILCAAAAAFTSHHC